MLSGLQSPSWISNEQKDLNIEAGILQYLPGQVQSETNCLHALKGEQGAKLTKKIGVVAITFVTAITVAP